MKKIVTTYILCGCLAAGSAFAQTNTQKTDVNRISFGLKGGYNYLLLSDRTDYATEINPSFGAFFEITANPLWGAGIEYLYMNNNQTAKVGDNLKSAMHGVTYYNSINVTNLVAKYRSPGWQKFNVYGNLGVGVGFYKYEFENSNDSKSGAQPFFMAGLSMEYNLAKWFALGLESQYRNNLDVKFMPEYTGTANLCGLNITARFKLGGNKNVRNIALADYEPNPCAQAPASNNSAAVNQQKQQISDLENTVTNQDEDIQTLQSQINDLKNKLEQNNEADKKTEKPKSKDAHTFANINFATNSSTIVSSSDSELDNLAEQLKQNPTWKVNVTGFADTTGNDAINNPLSKRRAEAIKTYLVKKGVAASAITTKGMGSKNPIATNKTPEGRALNRRVEIQVVK